MLRYRYYPRVYWILFVEGERESNSQTSDTEWNCPLITIARKTNAYYIFLLQKIYNTRFLLEKNFIKKIVVT